MYEKKGEGENFESEKIFGENKREKILETLGVNKIAKEEIKIKGKEREFDIWFFWKEKYICKNKLFYFGWHVEPDYQSYGYWSVLSRLDIRQTPSA